MVLGMAPDWEPASSGRALALWPVLAMASMGSASESVSMGSASESAMAMDSAILLRACTAGSDNCPSPRFPCSMFHTLY